MELYDCNNWSQSTSTVNSGVGFTKTATNCSKDQIRNRQDREQETTTLVIRNKGSFVENQTNTRAATGTKTPKTCGFDKSKTYVAKNGNSYTYSWAGSIQGTTTSKSLNNCGYKYTVGAYKLYSIYSFYEICREGI